MKGICGWWFFGVEWFGGMFLLPISKHFTVNLHESLLVAEALKTALSRQ